MKSKRTQLDQGSIQNHLLKMTGPMIFGTLGMMLFNIVDTIFIAQLGKTPLAAITFTFPMIMFMMSLSIGVGTGATSLISRVIGENNQIKVRKITLNSIWLSISLVIIFIVIGLLTLEPIFRLIGANKEQFVYIKDYMTIWYLGMIAVVVPMVGNSAIRSTGNTKIPSMIMVLSMIVNIILDPIMIFGLFGFPRMEVAGAALATVIARSVSLLLSLYFLHYKFDMLRLEIPNFSEMWTTWKKLLYIGIPTSATRTIAPIVTGIITALIATYGESSVAAFGIVSKLEGFSMVVVMAMGMSLGPIIGQNLGSKKINRILEAFKISSKFSAIWGFIVWGIFLLFDEFFGSMFSDDSEILHIVNFYFIIIGGSYAFRGILRMSSTTLNVINKPIDAGIINTVQSFFLNIPISYLLMQFWGLSGIFIGISITNIVAGIFSFYWTRKKILGISAQ